MRRSVEQLLNNEPSDEQMTHFERDHPILMEGMACVTFYLLILIVPTLLLSLAGAAMHMSWEGFMQPWMWEKFSRLTLFCYSLICVFPTVSSIKKTYRKPSYKMSNKLVNK